jgi:phosphoglycolate phosphatase
MIIEMGSSAVLFDLDGTLLDTLEDIADSMNRVLRQHRFPEHPVEAYKHYIGDGIDTLVRRVLPEGCTTPALLADCAAGMRAEYGRHWADKTRPYPGVPELLDALSTRGLPMAVLSNKPDDFTRLCVGMLLSQWRFTVVQGARADLARKPDPAGALDIARRFDLPPSEIIYLGDTNTDMQTAVAAGMYPVGALWGFRDAKELLAHGAEVLIERPIDLVDIFTARQAAAPEHPHRAPARGPKKNGGS